MSKIVHRRLGDLLNFKRGYDLPANSRRAGTYPIISSSGISGFHDEYKAEGEGLVTGRYGTLGEVYYINGRFWPHNTSLYVTDFKGNNPKYLYYLLRQIGHVKTSDKSTVPGINRNDLHEVIFPAVICLKEQTRIAAVLSALDAKIELNNRMNAELEGMAKLLYDYWFVQHDFPISAAQAAALGRPALTGHPYRTSGAPMHYHPQLKREIPKGWNVGSLLDIATFTNGIACQKFPPTSDEHLRVIKIREMHAGFTESSEKVTTEIPEKVIVHDGDILFSWSASLEVMIWTGGTGALNQHIFKVTSEDYPRSICFFTLQGCLQHFKMMAELRKTTMGHITREHLEQSLIAIPPKEIGNEFETLTEPIFAQIINNHQQNQELSRLRDWLLPMLMNGQVRVE